MFKIAYWVLGASSMGLLMFDAPSGSLLTSEPERGKVTMSKPDKNGESKRTVRGGPTFIWLGGGYHGGK
ncbi:MAG: hypothetical protein AAF799_31165 [Myxococcota bacterium]